MASKSGGSLNTEGTVTVNDTFTFDSYLFFELGDFSPHPDYTDFSGETWYYDDKDDIEVCITDKFRKYCEEHGLTDYGGEKDANYSLRDLFDYYRKLPSELKMVSSFHLDTRGMNRYDGKYRGSEEDVSLNPNAFVKKDGVLGNPFLTLTHEFIHAHDDGYSDEWRISGNTAWKDLMDKYPPLTSYIREVEVEDGGRYSSFYSESLADLGSLYVTSRINNDYAITNSGSGGVLTADGLRRDYPDVWDELDKYYGGMFK